MKTLISPLSPSVLTHALIVGFTLVGVSCRLKPIDDIGASGGSSRVSSVSMPIPAKLKPYMGDDKVNAWALSVVGGACANGTTTPVSHKEKFGLFSVSDVLINEKITANCAYTFVLSLGKASADKTKLETIYLTNDMDGKRTEITADQNKGGKVPVSVLLYFTADGTAALGAQSGVPLDPTPSTSSNTLTPSGTSNGASPLPDSSGPISSNSDQPATNSELTADPNCYKGDAVICKIEYLIAQKTNAYRRQSGLRELAYDSKISFVSRDWSKKQAARGDIGHEGFPGSRLAVYRQEFNTSVSMSAENVAYNFCSRGNEDYAASAFVNQWWNSSGHRRNMLGGFSAIGVGVHRDSRGACYGTQIFR